MKPTIVSHDPAEFHHSISMVGGEEDGRVFTSVEVKLSDGSISSAYICNDRPGYFQQVFLPWGCTVTIHKPT
jgi:hypothetical protein